MITWTVSQWDCFTIWLCCVIYWSRRPRALNASLNSDHFLAFDLSNIFCAFLDKLLRRSNLLDTFIVVLTRLDELLVMCHWIPTISWPLIGQAVSMHLQTNKWLNWAKIWLAILLQASLAWLTFGQIPLNSHHFLASDWWGSFCSFSDKLLLWLSWNLVSKLIGGLSLPV